MSTPLPEYERPPLNEVVLGVQFEPLMNLKAVHLGILWQQIRNRYPSTEDKSPLPHVIESNEVSPGKEAEIEIISRLPLPRCWFLDETKTNLIQLQRDRFVRNWRQIDGSEVYPRYKWVSQRFFEDLAEFRSFLKAENLGELRINQCELSYVNHFEPGMGWKDFSDLGSLFSFFRPKPLTSALDGPDLLNWSFRYKLQDELGAGHASTSTVFRGRDLKLVLALNLTARGAPKGANDDQIFAWFDRAHEWIVRAFDELTNPEMHRFWGKKS